MAVRGFRLAAVALLLVLAGCMGPTPPATDVSGDDPDGGGASDLPTASPGAGGAGGATTAGTPGTGANGTATGSSSAPASGNQSADPASGNDPGASTGNSSATSSGTSSSGSPASSPGPSTDPPAEYRFQLTLVNQGFTTPDTFDCYFDGSNRCDPAQALPGPGGSTLYQFSTSGAPGLLQVSAAYSQTWPAANHRFTWVSPDAAIVVQVSEAAVSASCSSGCALA
jgi:hypothetical protein